MNSIDRSDLQDIVTLAQNIKVDYLNADFSFGMDTYWKDYDELRMAKDTLTEWDIHTPLDVIAVLKDMWNYQNDSRMFDFSTLIAVAAFKNKECEENEREISPYIYEF